MLMSEAQHIHPGTQVGDTIDHLGLAMPPRVKIACGALTHQGKVRGEQ